MKNKGRNNKKSIPRSIPLSKKHRQLAKELLRGNRRSLSKLISLMDGQTPLALEILEFLHSKGKKAYRIGITGPPGAGKSTLVDRLVSLLRKKYGKKVGVIAIDPSSPFTGGALLGDRIRMQSHFNDGGVFIRSLSNRGERGGVSFSARLLASLYDAYGFDYTIIETVGVGQSEVDIMDLADSTVVVMVPESGDTIQTMKAGILEVADIFAVNKSDRDGADQIAEELEQMVMMQNNFNKGWIAPVVKTQAQKDVGIEELFDAINRHGTYAGSTSALSELRLQLKKREIIEIALANFKAKAEEKIDKNKVLCSKLNDLKANPYLLAKILIKTMR